ncbi:MAG: substrate-binding domain-containing protein [Campylobacterales bacterium]|nr:substrate-binding domain-containing protein [Campylobacterales bacterium]
MIKFIILTIFLTTLSFSKSSYTIAVLYWSMNIEGQVAMKNGLEKEFAKINSEATKHGKPTIELIRYIAGDGLNGIENQIKQFDEAISKKVDAIVIQPTDNAALSAGLKKANLAKIPVIAYDQYIVNGELASFITSNNYQAGFLNGEYVASKFRDKEIKIVLVEYPHVSSTVERVDGFFDALDKSKVKYKILKRYQAVEPVSGKKAGIDILKDFPTKGSIDTVFSVNDGGGLAVVEELHKANRDEILVATIDGDPKSIENIKNSRLTQIDSAQFCGALGAEAIALAYKKLNGETIAKQVLIPVFPITKETMELYHGWLSEFPKPFKKPWTSINPVWSPEKLEFNAIK